MLSSLRGEVIKETAQDKEVAKDVIKGHRKLFHSFFGLFEILLKLSDIFIIYSRK